MIEPSNSPIVLGILSALGIGAILKEVASGAMRHITGRSERERKVNADALSQRDDAWRHAAEERRHTEEERDLRLQAEASVRAAEKALRVISEYASSLRRLLIEHTDLTEKDLPPWPDTRRR